MAASVHALLVVRPDGRTPVDLHLQRTLSALAAQTQPVTALTIVVCGTDGAVRAVADASGAEGVIQASRGTTFAQALAMATHRVDADAVWLLRHDTAPGPQALARLVAVLETAPSITVAAPKLVQWDDPTRIVSLGSSMTASGRAVALAAGEVDQGQNDAREDVLGADVRGLLVRTGTWRDLHGVDDALGGADEGLDLGVRARRAGGRVVLAPGARIAVAPDVRAARPLSVRTARLHRRLVYAPAVAVPLHWLSILPLALVRSLGHLVAKTPGAIGAEWGAALRAMLRPAAVARSRAAMPRAVSWARVDALRVSRAEAKRQRDDRADAGPERGDLHFFAGGGAWVVLAALALSVVVFLPLLTWTSLGGGALAPMRSGLSALWQDVTASLRPLGWDSAGPPDPFSAVVALLGSLWPAAPGRVVVVLWLLALPLAALGGWFATTRISRRAWVRAGGAVLWMLAPPLWDGLVQGRPTAVLVHLLLPWLFWAAVVAHRSWGSAAPASLLAAAVLACAPSLAPGLLVLWIAGIVLVWVRLQGRGLTRLLWVPVPALALFAPLIVHRLQTGDPWALLADPGVVLADEGGVSGIRRLFLLAGSPGDDLLGWAAWVPAALVPWIALLGVPLLVAAVLSTLGRRVTLAAGLLATALVGLATANLALGIAVAATASAPAPLSPSPGLSLYLLGVTLAAALCLDQNVRPRVLPAAVTVLIVCAALLVVAPATAGIRGAWALQNGPATTLPAYVAAEGRAGGTATLVLTPGADGAVVADVVWGDTSALGGQSTLRSARSGVDAADLALAGRVAALVSEPSGSTVAELAAHGVGFVLLAAGDAEDTDAARTLRIAAATSMDQRGDLEIVGDTDKGRLWRVTEPVIARDAGVRDGILALLPLAGVLLALLLAVPTTTSVAAARRRSRLVDAAPRDGREG